jgi:hypothetical protein
VQPLQINPAKQFLTQVIVLPALAVPAVCLTPSTTISKSTPTATTTHPVTPPSSAATPTTEAAVPVVIGSRLRFIDMQAVATKVGSIQLICFYSRNWVLEIHVCHSGNQAKRCVNESTTRMETTADDDIPKETR